MSCNFHCQKNHKGEPHSGCSALTKKGTPCPHHADRLVLNEAGTAYLSVCHIHSPDGNYQQNVIRQREANLTKEKLS
jgi:hypothetical protein